MLTEAVAETGSLQGEALAAQLVGTGFDTGKSVPAAFDPETRQLQQSLLMVRVRPDEAIARSLAEVAGEIDLD